jgi:hypothetical protein
MPLRRSAGPAVRPRVRAACAAVLLLAACAEGARSGAAAEAAPQSAAGAAADTTPARPAVDSAQAAARATVQDSSRRPWRPRPRLPASAAPATAAAQDTATAAAAARARAVASGTLEPERGGLLGRRRATATSRSGTPGATSTRSGR